MNDFTNEKLVPKVAYLHRWALRGVLKEMDAMEPTRWPPISMVISFYSYLQHIICFEI